MNYERLYNLFPGILPPSPKLTSPDLLTAAAWNLLGEQFLVIGRKA
jgi:hypothetical protein